VIDWVFVTVLGLFAAFLAWLVLEVIKDLVSNWQTGELRTKNKIYHRRENPVRFRMGQTIEFVKLLLIGMMLALVGSILFTAIKDPEEIKRSAKREAVGPSNASP
jgi:hypothetical protein